jgi:hypothetical protein
MRTAALWRNRHPAARRLAAFAAVNLVLLNVVLPLATGTSLRHTALGDAGRVLLLAPVKDADSWRPMIAAVRCVREQPGQLLYASLFFARQTKFQYPPTSLLLTYPAELARVTATLARVGVSWTQLLNGMSWVFVLATAAFVVDLLRRGVGGAARAGVILLAGAGAVLAVSYYPVVRAYSLGQVQVWINALFAALVWCHAAGRQRTAGALAGLMCLIKPQYAFVLLWAVLRRQWPFAAAAALTGVAGLAVSVALFGVANHLDYLGVLAYLARHGESFYPNQSVNGLLHRLLSNGNNLEWDAHAFPPFHAAVWAGTTASSAALLGLALLWPVRGEARGSTLDLGVAVLSCTLASPVAWEHHYGVFLPVYAILFGALGGRRDGIMALVLLGVSYALTANFFVALTRLATPPANLLQSYALAGGLLALALAYRVRTHQPDASARER